MKLIDHTLRDFIHLLAANTLAPAGGSTAALEGTFGMALGYRAGVLSADVQSTGAHQTKIAVLLGKAKSIEQTLLDLVDRDTAAYQSVGAVFKMPGATEAEKTHKRAMMQAALKASTQTPHEMMHNALSALMLMAQILDKINPDTAGIIGMAALSLRTTVQGSWLSILFNLSGIQDRDFVDEYRAKSAAMLAQALPLADRIYATAIEIATGSDCFRTKKQNGV